MSLDIMSNMLSSVKNAAMAKKSGVEVMYSKQCEEVAKVLKDAGFLEDVKTFKISGKTHKMLRLDLAHEGFVYNISEVKRVSKPGHRIYKGSDEIDRVRGGFGVLVVSTSQGIMSGDKARSRKLGGEVICKVY